MKRADVGRFSVALDDRGEGAVAIQHPSILPKSGAMLLEPGELQDLLVALDAVQGDMPVPSQDDISWEVYSAFQGALHKVYRVAPMRMKLELCVNLDDFYRLVGKRPFKDYRDTLEADFGSFKLVCDRRRRV